MTAMTELVNAKGQPLTLERLEWAVARVTTRHAGRPLAAIRASAETRGAIAALRDSLDCEPQLCGLPVTAAPEQTGMFLEFVDGRGTVILRIENLSGGE